MKWAIALLVLLVACAPIVQETVTTQPVSQELQAPPVPEPVLEPTITTPEPVIIIEDENLPPPPPMKSLSPKDQCIETCGQNCQSTAQQSCTQKERSQCKSMCGDNLAIDPSACTQACTYLSQANVCKQRMEQFCNANCEGMCV